MCRSRSVGALAILLLTPVGCSKAAAVFFDLPGEEQPISSTSLNTASQEITGQAPAVIGDTVRDPLPIESIFDRDSALQLLPTDAAGNVDWVAAIRDGVIDPTGDEEPGADFAFDFYLKGEDPMMDAYFPHSSHVAWASCRTCHPDIFAYRGEPITMSQIGQGEACGRCHGPVAFAVETCERCHPAVELPPDRIETNFNGDIVFERSADAGPAGSIPTAYFPHWIHRIRYRCSECHPQTFSTRAGSTNITMEGMQNGETCGACHGSGEAFGVMDCNRCHDSAYSDGGPAP